MCREPASACGPDAHVPTPRLAEPWSAEAEATGKAPVVGGEALLRKTVYFMRHGQARHNVAEDQAKARAREEAGATGLAEGTAPFDAFLERARREALVDERLADPELSHAGLAQTALAREAIAGAPLPAPTAVLVSPLRRTLQTAEALFPSHGNVRVCDVLRERQTGFPCDRASSDRLAAAAAFPSFDFAGVPSEASSSSMSEASTTTPPPSPGRGTPSAQGERSTGAHAPLLCKPVGGAAPSSSESGEDDEEVEDCATLRRRTQGLAWLLAAVEDPVIAVVTHKGWLRELERGPLGRPYAREFKPCEVRAFEIVILPNGDMQAELLYSSARASEALC